MKEIISALSGYIVLQFALTLGASAQVPNVCPLPPDVLNCMQHMSWDDFPSTPPIGTVCCTGGLFSTFCQVRMKACGAPPNAADDANSCSVPKAGPPRAKTCDVGSPINVATGNTYIAETDISVPGLGGGLTLSRLWNSRLPSSQNTFPFMFGPNWRSTYEERLIFNSPDGTLKYARSDGGVWSFSAITVASPSVYQTVAPANDVTTITSGATVWTLASQNGEKRTFDATTGALLSIIDRNGNTTQLTYDSSGRLTAVTDPASRHLNFAYVGPSSNLVSTVTADVGISLSYAYDGQGRLTQITKPDTTTLSFVYNAQNLITSVKDSDGKILESHTYDTLGRGLTSSRANGVDSVTVTYPQ